ncbi:MAG TPA: methyltransferase domain-containing protein [Gemmatimonadaceae bacterium]|nr:methyltransferase domain-containing protein [Gemmatimonadaceae bacterium]
MKFNDHFSARAATYAAYRPLYPPGLFRELARLTNGHRLALDSGTGSGQAALGLAQHFEHVIATDPSKEQLTFAIRNPRVQYVCARAETSGLPESSVDLVTAAQAAHWFDLPAFFAEARRVLVAEGAIAVWGYGDPILDTSALHSTLHDFNRGLLESYWPPERQLLLDGYRTIAFPFNEVDFPRLMLEMRWTLRELAGYLRSWSATSRYVAEHGSDPVEAVEKALAAEWGDEHQTRVVRWPLYVRAGRVAAKPSHISRSS